MNEGDGVDPPLPSLSRAPLDDDVLAKRLGVSHCQSINQAARRLQSEGRLRRYTGPDGKIVNACRSVGDLWSPQRHPSP